VGLEGQILAALQATRRRGEQIKVGDAAKLAGTNPANVRKWRHRDPRFAAAERAIRTDRRYQDPATEPGVEPLPASLAPLRARWDRSLKICNDIGPGPWRGTRFRAEQNAGTYDAHRAALIEISAKLRAAGHDPGPIPESRPAPTMRFRRSAWGAPDWAVRR
jgi:hypothetical protein